MTRVDCYTARDWLGAGFLCTGRAMPPFTKPVKLYTHSWISGSSSASEDVLRRIDYLADTQGVLMVVGVNNGQDKPIPALLASAYNVISVGEWNGHSSGGYTTVDGAGRCKPEIVAPGDMTSFATPVVAGVVVRLMEEARQPGSSTDARRPQVLKAVLLAGADKPPGWHCDPGKPLAQHFGAGRVRLDNSYQILAAGPIPCDAANSAPEIPPPEISRGNPDSIIHHVFHLPARYGWSYADLAPGQSHDYLFTTPRTLGEASLVLVWHRRIDGQINRDLLSGRFYWSNQPRLGHLGLSLYVRDDAGHETLTAQSISAIDNLQHIYFPALPPGRYRIQVGRRDAMDEPWDYALAWRIEPALGEAVR